MCSYYKQQFFNMRMKPNVEVVNHIGYVEQNNNQLTNLNEPMLEHVIIYKILNTLPSHFSHMHLAWGNIPHYE